MTFDVTLLLSTGGSVNIRQISTSANTLLADLQRQLGGDDNEARLTSRQEGIVLVLKRPRDLVVGMMVDQID